MFKVANKLLVCRRIMNTRQCRLQSSSEVEIFINGKEVRVPSYFSVIQALRRENVTMPSFCYHERLSIAGNCRMCLVEIEGVFKPQIACGLPVQKNMKIRTNSKLALKAQEGVLEFILVDHPLDCPICDQGGECDLQDLTMKFGNDRSRFTDIHFLGKRAVEDNNFGPLIRGEMNRCIHCTRCIRFGSQICGIDVLGTSGRGHDMLVGTYVPKMFLSELSGNVIDLCPVGSLTAKPYKFKARPWELYRTNSIDVTDATGTNIVLCSRFDRVLRVLPCENEEVNQEWVSDKGRFSIDSLEMQRLATPMARVNSCLCPVDWDWALRSAAHIIGSAPKDKVVAIAGPHSSVETLVTCKDFLNALGCENTYIPRNLLIPTGIDLRANYLLNTPMQDIANADNILLVGTNPRFEAPILNVWIRQAYRNNECDIYAVGPYCEYNYFVEYLGCDTIAISAFQERLMSAKNPLIFVGVGRLGDKRIGPSILSVLTSVTSKLKKPVSIVNVVSREASFAGALEAGWKPGGLDYVKENSPEVIICLGGDEIFSEWTPPPNCKIIYIGFQGDKGCQYASLVLPGCAFSETGGTFMNMEGRAQYAWPAVTAPGHAREDWKILRALAEYCEICLRYDDLPSLQCRMGQISPNFLTLNQYQDKLFAQLTDGFGGEFHVQGEIEVDLKTLREFYCSDIFSANSPTMIKACTAAHEYVQSSYARN